MYQVVVLSQGWSTGFFFTGQGEGEVNHYYNWGERRVLTILLMRTVLQGDVDQVVMNK